MLSQVPVQERSLANSVANLFYNLCGYLPAPILYGVWEDKSAMGFPLLETFGLLTVFAATTAASIGKLLTVKEACVAIVTILKSQLEYYQQKESEALGQGTQQPLPSRDQSSLLTQF